MQWTKFFCKTGIWLTVEIWLNLIGLDNIADYSEFVFAKDLELDKNHHKTVNIADLEALFCPEIYEYCPISNITIDSLNLSLDQAQTKATKVLEHKCQQLKQPCIKVLCLNHIQSIAFVDND
jgi:hypothetical protein